MNNCPWETIESFTDYSEFERFVDWMASQVKDGVAVEKVPSSPYVGPTFQQRWFEHVASNTTWRLVFPDAPFSGVFEPVLFSSQA